SAVFFGGGVRQEGAACGNLGEPRQDVLAVFELLRRVFDPFAASLFTRKEVAESLDSGAGVFLGQGREPRAQHEQVERMLNNSTGPERAWFLRVFPGTARLVVPDRKGVRIR